MAERRMFAKSVVNSARFLRMPPTSRLLYYDLGMAADDDGIVEAYTVMRTTSATEDDLRVLAAKGFVKVLNEDLVTGILDWKTNNLIKKDRYHPSIYADLLVQLQDGTKAEPDRNQYGTQMEPEVRLGKDSLGKARSGDAVEPDRNPSVDDVRRFMDEYSTGKGLNVDTARASERFWNHYAGKGWNIHDWKPLAVNWIEGDARKGAAPSNPALQYEQRTLTDDDFAGCLIPLDGSVLP